MSDIASRISSRLRSLSDSGQALVAKRFFKTGPGEYAENDRFLGTTVPQIRGLAKEFLSANPKDLIPLLKSRWHEERLCCLVIWVTQFRKSQSHNEKRILFDLYSTHIAHINNWDLVDISAAQLFGEYLLETRNPAPLTELLKSRSLWERRIAIVSTWAWIKSGDISLTLRFAEALFHDSEDLIHKATGWMLREVGKREVTTLQKFLDRHAAAMPRTMLRYAIERLPEDERLAYLACRRA